jgi:hypothetical protein
VALATCVSLAAQGGPPSQPTEKERERDQAFQDFQQRVKAYIELRKKVEESVPPAKPTDQPERIQARRLLLAQKMMGARKDAKPGDIFGHEISEEFRKQIHRTFSGPEGKELRRTIRQGDPVKLRLYINTTYPEDFPVTTMPPTLLSALPKLPPEVEYRVVGRDFVLQDAELRLVLDFIREAYPKPAR